jgi:ribosomal protein L11 methyltransferase
MTDLFELALEVTPALEELATLRLESLGSQGVVSEQVSNQPMLWVKGYFSEEPDQVTVQSLEQQLFEDAERLEVPVPILKTRLVREEDWATAWRQYWHPRPVGERFLVCPVWETPPSEYKDRLLIRIDPGFAFGTGEHSTTRLCLVGLEQLLEEGPVALVADVGCGSGILALGALLLEVPKVIAVDIDPLAVKATQVNLEEAGFAAQATVFVGSAEDILKLAVPVDGLVCNILADVICQIAEDLTALVKPGGWGLFSGLLTTQAAMVMERLEPLGWYRECTLSEEPWAALILHKT